MDIRTKLVFALVAVSLGSMVALGAFAYDAAGDLLQRVALRQLEAVAETKKQHLEKVIVGWRDRVLLVTSRTQLREVLRDWQSSEDPNRVSRVERILTDAVDSVRALRGISVYTASGLFVASAGADPVSRERVRPAAFMWAEEPVIYENVSFDADGELLVTFVAPMRIDRRLVGAAKVRLAARELIDVTKDYTGLGETGETLMARRTKDGAALVLSPLRHDKTPGAGHRIGPEQAADPTLRAVLGHEGTHLEGAVDYRGEEVWAATRYLDEFDWGLVVKVDASEELRAVHELRDTMGKLAIALSAFAIVVGTLLGFYFAAPIRELADVARRIGAGERDLRANPRGEDELALLAQTMNEMAEELIRSDRQREERTDSGEAPDEGAAESAS